eukprot:CFRG0091T1
MKEERVEWTNTGSGLKLVGTLNRKNLDTTDIVVFCHGLFSDKNTPLMKIVDDSLVDHNTFRLDFRGNGESEGKRRFGNYEEERLDLESACTHLQSLGYQVTTLIGHSKGAVICLWYASLYPGKVKIINLAGRYKMDHVPQGRFSEEQQRELKVEGQTTWHVRGMVLHLSQEDIVNRSKFDVGGIVRQVKDEVLTIHGDQDRTTPVTDVKLFDDAIPNHKYRIIQGANHFFSRPEMYQPVCQAICDWMRERTNHVRLN